MGLEHLLPDLTAAAPSAELPGLKLPALVNGTWARTLPSKCRGCPKAAADHKIWERVGINTLAPRACYQELIDIADEMRTYPRTLGIIGQLMNRIASGIYNDYSVGEHPTASTYTWRVASASGNRITLYYEAGREDPRALQYLYTYENPDWEPGSETEDRYITDVYESGAPVMGLVTLNAASQLAYHGGWIVRKLIVDENLQIGDTFQIEFWNPIGPGVATEIMPGHEGEDIEATLAVYMLAHENIPALRDAYPLFCLQDVYYITSPTNGVHLIDGKRLRKPTANPAWCRGHKYVTGTGWVDDAAIVAGVYIAHNGSGYNSYVDLTSVDLTDVAWVRIECWVESSSALAIPIGQDRCKWSQYDPSWGWHCALRGTLEALGAPGIAWLETYKEECYQTKCPGYTEDEPDTPLAQNVWRALTHAHLWRLEQYYAGEEEMHLSRPAWPNGFPGLGAAAGFGLDLPGGIFPTIECELGMGGWPARKIATDGSVALVAGAEILTANKDGGEMRQDTTSTWPDFGPGGDNISSRVFEGGPAGTAVSAANDPHRLARQCSASSGVDKAMYGGEIYGSHGRRIRWTDYTLWLPKTDAGSGPVEDTDGTYRRGAWNAKFQAVSEGDPTTVYRWRWDLKKSLRYDRILDGQGWPIAVNTATVHTASLAGGALTLALAHKTFTGSIQTGPGEETEFYFQQGGGNVAAMDQAGRIRNWKCEQSHIGAGRGLGYIRPGSVISFEHAAFNGTILAGLRLLVTEAVACGSALTDTWIPPTVVYGGTSDEYYDAWIAPMDSEGGLPDGHRTIFNHLDQIKCADEAFGIVAAYLAEQGATALNNKTIYVYENPCAYPGVCALTHTPWTGGEPGSDQVVSADDYAFLGASGIIYGKTELAAGDCYHAAVKIADNRWLAEASEFHALRTYAERLMDCLALSFTPISSPPTGLQATVWYSYSERFAPESVHDSEADPNGDWDVTYSESYVPRTPDNYLATGATPASDAEWSVLMAYTRSCGLVLTRYPFRVGQLDRSPWNAAIESAAANLSIANFQRITQRITYDWTKVSSGQWIVASEPVVETSAPASLGITQIVVEGGEFREQILDVGGGGGTIVDGAIKNAVLTSLTQAMAANANKCTAFGMLVTGPNGITPMTEVNQSFMKALMNDLMVDNRSYEWIEDAFFGSWIAVSGTVDLTRYEWSITFGLDQYHCSLGPDLVTLHADAAMGGAPPPKQTPLA